MSQTQAAQHVTLRCRTIIEVLGKPKEHVEQAIKDYITKLSEDEDYVILNKEFSKPEEQDDGYWSMFVELELVSKGIENMIKFCFEYMPSSIEITKPDNLDMPIRSINHLFNDLQSRLHNVDMIVKKQKNENTFLRKNMRTAITNMIMMALYKNEFTLQKLSSIVGLEQDQIQPFLETLISEGKVQKDGETYKRTEKKGQS